MAPEALAVLDAPGEPEPGAALARRGLERQRLAAAAAVLLDPLDEAANVLEAPEHDADPEIALWRAALAGAREDWQRGASELARARRPGRLSAGAAAEARLPAALAAIEAGATELAMQVLSGLEQLDLSRGQGAQLSFHKGLALARLGAIDRADEIWRTLQDGSDYDSRIKATYARTQMLLDAGRIGPDEAVARLAAVRPLWRGHPWEAKMLEGLAGLYRESGDQAAAIRTWRDLLVEFPTLPNAGRIELAMRDTFRMALQQDGAIGAMRAYALYRDFPELVADGAAGDQLRHRVAAQLADAELLEPAAALLDDLVQRRLSGPAKAAAGADLAALRLREPDPAAALAALERSATADALPEGLERRRRLLRARALAAAGRPAEALAVLDGRRAPGEQALAAEILADP